MTNTLGLVGDMDDVDLILDIQRAFGVKFSDEVTSWYTVGDIHAALLGRFEAGGDIQGGCATAMAFYRVRRWFTAQFGGPKLHADTAVPLSRHRRAARMIRRLQKDTGLRMPYCQFTWLGNIGAGVMILGLLAIVPALMADITFWTPLTVAGVGLVICLLDPQTLPDDCRTVGQLATKVARLNRAELIAQGAAARLSDIWDDLVEVLVEHADIPKSEIRADTLLIRK